VCLGVILYRRDPLAPRQIDAVGPDGRVQADLAPGGFGGWGRFAVLALNHPIGRLSALAPQVHSAAAPTSVTKLEKCA
jgi:hypothetical protein